MYHILESTHSTTISASLSMTFVSPAFCLTSRTLVCRPPSLPANVLRSHSLPGEEQREDRNDSRREDGAVCTATSRVWGSANVCGCSGGAVVPRCLRDCRPVVATCTAGSAWQVCISTTWAVSEHMQTRTQTHTHGHARTHARTPAPAHAPTPAHTYHQNDLTNPIWTPSSLQTIVHM